MLIRTDKTPWLAFPSQSIQPPAKIIQKPITTKNLIDNGKEEQYGKCVCVWERERERERERVMLCIVGVKNKKQKSTSCLSV